MDLHALRHEPVQLRERQTGRSRHGLHVGIPAFVSDRHHARPARLVREADHQLGRAPFVDREGRRRTHDDLASVVLDLRRPHVRVREAGRARADRGLARADIDIVERLNDHGLVRSPVAGRELESRLSQERPQVLIAARVRHRYHHILLRPARQVHPKRVRLVLVHAEGGGGDDDRLPIVV